MAKSSLTSKIARTAFLASALFAGSCLPFSNPYKTQSTQIREEPINLESLEHQISFLNPNDFYEATQMQPDLRLSELEKGPLNNKYPEENIKHQYSPENTPKGKRFLSKILKESEECHCYGSTCDVIASHSLDSSKRRKNIDDPLILAAIAAKESNCNPDSYSSRRALGPTQIIEGTYMHHCYGTIARKPFWSLRNPSNWGLAMDCTSKILEDKAEEGVLKNGIRGSWAYKNDKGHREIVDNCIKKFPKYGEYRGIEAVLRLYNGAGCDRESGADPDYVEKVMAKRDRLADAYQTIVASSK